MGGISGGIEGAAGAAATASAAPLLNELQGNITKNLINAGAGETVAKGAASLIANLTSAGLGGAVSGGSTAGASGGLNTDANNRQLHQDEINKIKEKAKEYAKEKGITQEEAEQQLTETALAEVDSTHNQVYGKQVSSDAQAYLKQFNDQGLFVRDSDYTNFNKNGEVFEKNLDFYSKNLAENNIFIIEHDPNNRYGATAYKRNDDGTLQKVDNFVTRSDQKYANQNGEPVTVKEGVYGYEVDLYKKNYTPKIINSYNLENIGEDKLPTIYPDKTNNNAYWAEGILIHLMNNPYSSGKSGTVGSQGCWGFWDSSFPKGQYQYFWNTKDGEKGNVILIRPNGDAK